MRESELGLRQTMLQALREVEDARANLVSSDEATRRLGSALAASDKALGLANQLYKGGATDFLDVLSAQEVYLRDSDSLNQVKREHALAAVALYRSLGVGGAGMTRRVGRRWRRWRGTERDHDAAPASTLAGARSSAARSQAFDR